MSKFCVNCGKKISNNQTCDCTVTKWDSNEFREDSMVNMDSSNSPYYTTKFSSNINFKNIKSKLDFLKNMLNIIIKYLKNPQNTLIEYSYSNNKSIIIFFMCIQGIFAALFTTFSSKNLLIYSYLKLYSADEKTNYENILHQIELKSVEHIYIFCKTLLIYIILSIIIIALLKFTIKKQEQLLPILTTLSLNSIPITISLIPAFLTFNISNLFIPLIGVFLIFYSIILSSILSYNILKDSIKTNQIYITYITVLILALYYFIILNPILKLF